MRVKFAASVSLANFAGYTIRHGLAITMEHNFMMSEKGRENFKNQLQQVGQMYSFLALALAN